MFTKILEKMLKKKIETSSFEIDRQLPVGKNKKVIGLTKDKLGGKIMRNFVGLRANTYSYLKDNDGEDKKAKCSKKCAIKRNLKLRDYKNIQKHHKLKIK